MSGAEENPQFRHLEEDEVIVLRSEHVREDLSVEDYSDVNRGFLIEAYHDAIKVVNTYKAIIEKYPILRGVLIAIDDKPAADTADIGSLEIVELEEGSILFGVVVKQDLNIYQELVVNDPYFVAALASNVGRDTLSSIELLCFTVAHEFGHVYELLETTPDNRTSSYSLRNSLPDEWYELDTAFRQLPSEVYADGFAASFNDSFL